MERIRENHTILKLFQMMMKYQNEALLGISVKEDGDYTCIFANDRARGWLVHPDLEIPFHPLIRSDYYETFEKDLAAATLSRNVVENHFANLYPITSNEEVHYILVVLHLDNHSLINNDDELLHVDELVKRFPDESPDAIIIGNASGKIIYVNPAFERLFEWSCGEIIGLNIDYVPIVPDHLMDEVKAQYLKAPSKTIPPLFTSQRIKKDGSVINVSILVSAIKDSHGLIQGFTAVFRQIEKTNETPEIVTSRQLYKSLFQWNPDAVFMIDLKGCFISANPACEKLTDYAVDELMHRSYIPLIVEEERQKVMRHFSKSAKGTPQNFESTVVRKDGNLVKLNITNIPIIVDGEVVGVYGIAKDVTKQREAEAKIQHMAYYDQLTKLPNRSLFMDQLSKAIRQSSSSGERTAVIYVDVDRFKSVNDTYGHSYGDRFLKHISHKLQSCISKEATLARMGGDEFTILLACVGDTSEAITLAEGILSVFQKALVFEERTAYIGVSIGIALSKGMEYTADELLTQADIAMYNVKQNGKSGYIVYSTDFHLDSAKKRLEHDLPGALDSEAIEVYYQPIANIQSGRITGMEALIRWKHPEFGSISPEEIIPLAEETGLIVQLGKTVLRRSCLVMKELVEQGHSDIRIAVNLSIRQLQQADFIESTCRILNEIQLSPKYVEFEVTESIVMEDLLLVVDHLKKLRKLGMKISIDDFGTGYASLSYLQQLPIDKIKIDRMFILNIKNDISGTIPSTIVNLARALELEVIAEGVETLDQFSHVRNWGCDELQGYLFSRPIPFDQLKRLLDSGKSLKGLLIQE